jgi:hypothetical protein
MPFHDFVKKINNDSLVIRWPIKRFRSRKPLSAFSMRRWQRFLLFPFFIRERRGEEREEFSCKFTVSRNFKNQNYFLIENYVGFKNCDKK